MSVPTTNDNTETKKDSGCTESPEESWGGGGGGDISMILQLRQKRFCQVVICSHYEISRKEKISMQMRHRCA